MVDKRTPGSLKPLNEQNGVIDGTSKSQLCQRQIAHATIVIVVNNRYITIYTLGIHPAKDDSMIATPTIHRCIFDAIRQIDASAAIISLDQAHYRTCDITKREYVSFKIASTHIVSQLKYGSTINDYKGIFDTFLENSTLLKMNKFRSHTDISIAFFLRINPKLILRKVLKEKIYEVFT